MLALQYKAYGGPDVLEWAEAPARNGPPLEDVASPYAPPCLIGGRAAQPVLPRRTTASKPAARSKTAPVTTHSYPAEFAPWIRSLMP
ncbi:MAG: hypothetical protein ACRDPL_16785, partial [Propionibacteriaceae bacterium]